MFATKEGHLDVVKSLMWKNKADLNIQEQVRRKIEIKVLVSFTHFSQEAKFSVPFFAVHCKRLDILDVFLSSGKMNFGITDLVHTYTWHSNFVFSFFQVYCLLSFFVIVIFLLF